MRKIHDRHEKHNEEHLRENHNNGHELEADCPNFCSLRIVQNVLEPNIDPM